MPQLGETRLGWENEHLATYLLSRISFVAHPMTVADDVGSDFFCTLFERRQHNGKEQLFPLNSFAIQVKTKGRWKTVAATKQRDYLWKLELPYFLGVVDRKEHQLAVYSGEWIPLMFSKMGYPKEKLTLIPCEPTEVAQLGPYYGVDEKIATLQMPKVMTLSATDSPQTFAENARALATLATRVHSNVVARSKTEYLFDVGTDRPKTMAGPSSAKTFRDNFYQRLEEVFHNLEWGLREYPKDFNAREFAAYERLFNDLPKAGRSLPEGVGERYRSLKVMLGKKGRARKAPKKK